MAHHHVGQGEQFVLDVVHQAFGPSIGQDLELDYGTLQLASG